MTASVARDDIPWLLVPELPEMQNRWFRLATLWRPVALVALAPGTFVALAAILLLFLGWESTLVRHICGDMPGRNGACFRSVEEGSMYALTVLFADILWLWGAAILSILQFATLRRRRQNLRNGFPAASHVDILDVEQRFLLRDSALAKFWYATWNLFVVAGLAFFLAYEWFLMLVGLAGAAPVALRAAALIPTWWGWSKAKVAFRWRRSWAKLEEEYRESLARLAARAPSPVTPRPIRFDPWKGPAASPGPFQSPKSRPPRSPNP